MRRAIYTVLAAGLASAITASAAHTLPSELPDRPHDMGDLYVVEQNGAWFCLDQAGPPSKICPAASSQQRVQSVVEYLYYQAFGPTTAPKGAPRLLRAAKARKTCPRNRPATAPGSAPNTADPCWTGVPPKTACPTYNATPYCALTSLQLWGIGLGVIMGSEDPDEDDGDGARTVKEMAWHACEIRRTDIAQRDDPTTPRVELLYDFIFLDEADVLEGDLREVVQRITNGQIYKDDAWRPCNASVRDWKVITNDNGWRGSTHPLNTLAWGHTKQLDILRSGDWRGRVENAMTTDYWIRQDDRQFVDAVNAATPAGHQTRAILRTEVSSQTARLAQLPLDRRCRLLRQVSAEQSAREPQFTFISPLYIHAVGSTEHPYDSVAKNTFVRQMELFHRYQQPDRPDYGFKQPC